MSSSAPSGSSRHSGSTSIRPASTRMASSSRPSSSSRFGSSSIAVLPSSSMESGLPRSIFYPTLAALLLYMCDILMLLFIPKCGYGRGKARFYIQLHVAAYCVAFMLFINVRQSRFQYQKLSMVASLLYSASAFMMALAEWDAFINGICTFNGPQIKDIATYTRYDLSILSQNEPLQVVVWLMPLPAIAIQCYTHYYYG